MTSITARAVVDDLVGNAEGLVGLLRERSAAIESAAVLTEDVVAAMDAAGMYRIGVPRRWGGLYPVPTAVSWRVVFQLARGNGAAAWSVAASVPALTTEGFDERVAEEVYGGEHAGPLIAGSVFNLSHAIGVGERVDDGFMVSGSWSFSSDIRRAAWLGAGFDCAADDGARYSALIPREQCRVADDWRVTGLRGTSSNTAFIEEPVFVPDYRVRTERLDDWEGEQTVEDTLAQAATNIDLAAMSAGLAEGALETFEEKAVRRAPWGQPYERIADMPTAHMLVGRSRMRIDSALAALDGWTRRIDEHGEKPLTLDEAKRIGSAAIFLLNDLRRVPEELRNGIGSSTTRSSDELGRYARDAVTLCLHGVHRIDWETETRGREMFGLTPPRAVTFSSALGRPELPDNVELIERDDGVPW